MLVVRDMISGRYIWVDYSKRYLNWIETLMYLFTNVLRFSNLDVNRR